MSQSALLKFTRELLEAADIPPEKAQLISESLVSASLRGVDSHGIHLLPHYLSQIEAGNIVPDAQGRIVLESGACLIFEGEKGFGQWTSEQCCVHAVRLTRKHGLGLVIARNSTHFGAAAFWAQRISAAGLIGLVVSNASPTVPPWQGKEGRVGTNPLCMSVPSTGEGSWLLDMATTTVALNKVVKASLNGEPEIPAGWAMDSHGVPTTDTREALTGLLMPLGGYKGSGLGLMIEILCGVLSGGAMSTDVGGLHLLNQPMNTSHAFLGIDITRFLPLTEFQSRMEHLVREVKSAAAAADFDEVLVAGDPEQRYKRERSLKGVPIENSLWEKLSELAQQLGVSLP